MNKLVTLKCDPTNPQKSSKEFAFLIDEGFWVQLIHPINNKAAIPNHLLPSGPGVVITSGGSTGGPSHCLQPCTNLDQSALATGHWLKKQGLEPKNCLILNSLPFHHVSGLMPWWRSRLWEIEHKWLLPSQLKDPKTLQKSCEALFKKKTYSCITSLVPTQLQRLINHPAGIQWLQSFAVIWVGGSALSDNLAKKARRKNINLAPCYGSTETAAMVTVLSPKEFLKGSNDCGHPLDDVNLRLSQNGALEIKTPRLASGRWIDNKIEFLQDQDGWWQSADAAKLTFNQNSYSLEVIGRLDTAFHSGGETIFPEKLESKLLDHILRMELPIENLILLPINDKEWGERLVALIRFNSKVTKNDQDEALQKLEKTTQAWMPAERPITWYTCDELTNNKVGKFERSRWKNWITKIKKGKL